jgi:ABC-type branched-subunit amino acid transport system substrate-binding protein
MKETCMNKSLTTLRLAAGLGAMSLVLAACGGGGTAGSEGKAKAPAAPASVDGVLTVGTILPRTGDLAFLGPPEFAGVDLAVKEINEAGGVLGKPMNKIHKDSGDAKTDIASQSVDSLLQQKADAVFGAASSGVSFTVIDKIVNSGRIQFSPANTSDRFTTYNDKNLYFRTAPPDKLQGRVLADEMASDENERIYVLNRQDDYGTGLANNIKDFLSQSGIEPVGLKAYAADAQEFSAEVTDIKSKKPDAIALITFEELKKIGPELIKQGMGPDKVQWYLVDGNMSDYSKDPEFTKGQLKGVKATTPGANPPAAFRKDLLKIDPKLKDYTYAAESYDGINLIALGAEAAKSDDPKKIAAAMAEVSKGGEKCKDFKECSELLKEGKDIDYDGISGPVEFTDAGDPAEATIGVFTYDATNKPGSPKFKSGKIEG